MSLTQPAEPIARRSLHRELVDRVQEMIVEGVLPPGTKVPERELCDRFGVSRTPMREALKVLASDGLVTLEPNRGAWVTEITLAELEEVFPVMGALEALSGELACQRIDTAALQSIRAIHNAMMDHYKARNLVEYFRANQQIHEAILTAADNPTLSAQYRGLASRIRRARYVANMTEARWSRAVAEHVQIIDALEKRQGDRLAHILKQHLANKIETVRAWLEASKAP